MKKYEVMFIIAPSLEEEAIEAAIAKYSDIITTNGGEIEKVEKWGKRRLAYDIDRITEGYYVLTLFQSPSSVCQELERLLRIDEEILRYLIVLREE
ncbi:MAG TPA: 30S ribosomal protein S6 [Firmicutes bacterium]|jgi:small subunit ribosomal protein S6|nr:30S ribosomal protein S6 [Bacillota bacterium]HAW70111.1 30S ribosomal protein S6 [Bacillota bacterium]HAZ21004.1 30S ribosomal protein S6 [Bacillota bacterium]HBE06949.1 30S ribosomal protein S6 [Bacillota bacterium]HBG44541.1 30S ribosomal protein S6 [Bacillota bacterium]